MNEYSKTGAVIITTVALAAIGAGVLIFKKIKGGKKEEPEQLETVEA